MTNRDKILEYFSKLDDKHLFKVFCRANVLCQQCMFFKKDCQKHEQWLSEKAEEEAKYDGSV